MGMRLAMNWAVRMFEQWKGAKQQVMTVKCVLPTCCTALSRCHSITGCHVLLLNLIQRMDSRIHLCLFKICWLVCAIPLPNPLHKTVDGSCYANYLYLSHLPSGWH